MNFTNFRTEIKKNKSVLLFTLIYLIPFTYYFFSTEKGEFIWYSLVVIGLFILVLLTISKSKFHSGVIWGLSVWGLLHLAGGSIRAGSDVLYGLVLIPIINNGEELIIFKYDQLVHAFGFGLCTYIIFHFLKRYTKNPHTIGVYLIAIFAGMGLGSLNEIVEFVAVLLFPDNGVGGYVNTSLDLVFNTIGAILVISFVAINYKIKNKKPLN